MPPASVPVTRPASSSLPVSPLPTIPLTTNPTARPMPVLVPNERGYERALAVGAREVAVFTAASEAFNRRNINASIDESIERFVPVLARARSDGVRVRGYVSTVLGCHPCGHHHAFSASGRVQARKTFSGGARNQRLSRMA